MLVDYSLMMVNVTRYHHGELPNRVTSRLQRRYRTYHGGIPWSSIHRGLYYLYFTFCGRASGKIGVRLTAFIESLILDTENQKEIWGAANDNWPKRQNNKRPKNAFKVCSVKNDHNSADIHCRRLNIFFLETLGKDESDDNGFYSFR